MCSKLLQCLVVCSVFVRISTQAWVFTLEVPISSWRWQESMSWLSSNELLQQNSSASFSLCLFSSSALRVWTCFSIPCLALFLPAHCLFPVIFFCIVHLFYYFFPFASVPALSFHVGTQLSYYSTLLTADFFLFLPPVKWGHIAFLHSTEGWGELNKLFQRLLNFPNAPLTSHLPQ